MRAASFAERTYRVWCSRGPLQVQALLLRLTGDPSRDVVEALLCHVLPALLRGLGSSALLTTQLLPKVCA